MRDDKKIVKIELDSQEEVDQLTDGCKRILQFKESLGDHLEERVSAFFLQIVDCYDTDKHFTIGKTEIQAEKTEKIEFKSVKGLKLPQNASKTIGYEAAHHGTIPCLYAYDRNEWEIWKSKGSYKAAQKPVAAVYLKNSDTYFANNACTGLEREINRADIDIDGNSTERTVEFGTKKTNDKMKLREYSIDLLNQAAQKKIDPIEGLELFIEKLRLMIDSCKGAYLEGERKTIFECWEKDLENLTNEYQDDYQGFVLRMLHINLDSTDQNPALVKIREAVFPEQFRVLQLKNRYRTEVEVRVEKLKEDILSKSKKKPRSFDKAFKVSLMESVKGRSKEIQTIFQRYYNCNGATLDQLKRDTPKPALELVSLKKSKAMIKNFFDEFTQYMNDFSIKKSESSSGLMKTIRGARALSLRRFASRHNIKFPDAQRLNHEQYRRIEEGCVKLTPEMAERFAKVLDVDKSVLLMDFLL